MNILALMCFTLAIAVDDAPASATVVQEYPAVGAAGPALDLPDLTGKRVQLGDLRGKSVVLNFWAFWCDTWRAEMPHLHELATRQNDLNFRIVAISVDGTRLPEFAPGASSNLPFPVLLDIGGRVTASYQVEHVPTVVLLDSEGRVRYSCVAWPGNQAVLNQLRKLASDPTARLVSPAGATEIGIRPRGASARRRRPARSLANRRNRRARGVPERGTELRNRVPGVH